MSRKQLLSVISAGLFLFTMLGREGRRELYTVPAMPGFDILHNSAEHDRGQPADAFAFDTLYEQFSRTLLIASSRNDGLCDNLYQFSLMRS